MKAWKHIVSLILFAILSLPVHAESSYDIAQIYEISEPPSGTIAIGSFDKIKDVEYILTPTRIDTGKYVVEVKKIGDNLYRILRTDICIETRYCHEWASYSEEVVLIIESNFGYTKGKVIFD
ncbi:MAG: hypothetical protein HDS75_04490 [Bacteroidales bacterium]|nr:hypothetical protein [Bacteroidales bacterium]MDE6801234.1 hypothetical protein [Muribaculaceae bacterium]MDE6832340.1 hypothetical protein [Muribaculaceae bacterium]